MDQVLVGAVDDVVDRRDVVLGAGLTVLVCATSAEWLASAEADENPASFVTWGMMFAQITAIVLGTLAVTSEYGTA